MLVEVGENVLNCYDVAGVRGGLAEEFHELFRKIFCFDVLPY